MPNPNANVPDNARNKAALTFLGLLVAVAGGSYALFSNPDKSYIEARPVVASDASYSHCWRGTVRADPALWAALGLEVKDGGSGLAYASSCFALPPECADAGGLVDDAGEDLCGAPDQALPLGFEWTPGDEEVVAWAPGDPLFAVWTAENDDAPFRCACGARTRPSDGPCEKLVDGLWVPATEDDMGMQAGQWRGGCKRIPCSAWGESTTPTECCTTRCKPGWECGANKCGGTCGTCGEGTECRGHKCVALPGPDAGEEPDAELAP
ncbi:MAG: hypothetical protein WC729_29285 [Sphingomonas sp.]|jgi:hypothetical protein|uniref:hypothetical protein n=1 Tax=Sphingomonas sp. TaxID=28214 RepID=UPI003566D54E